MSYADYARQLARAAWAAAALVHAHAGPYCRQLVEQAAAQWPPLQTVLAVSGPAAAAYALELALVYAAASLALLAVRAVSSTLYRLLRLVAAALVLAAAVALGLYLYLAAHGQQGAAALRSTGGSFWVEQAAALASMLAGAQHHQHQPDRRQDPFRYQAPHR
ncbi:hypothetical protein H4R18_004476 [Coemansia javaensis]|uniref:Uncharacterized protein n=1 Tax=Coemansia javaensis TaxID=2761396 RepID=A0A9W8LES3_9FUNG|nr:hypothetical protein H4R18_004476 [Coemansia javaensis]